jgi:ribose 5-phosphate isomerase A
MNLKEEVALKALKLVESGMVIGLGTGSTMKFFIDHLGRKIQAGELKNIVAVPTSEATRQQAVGLDIPLSELEHHSQLDLAVDGADEVDPNLNLIKGWGGALVREKLVELYTARLVIVVDQSKLVDRLGTHGALPVEVVPFAWQVQSDWLARQLQCRVELRCHDDQPYVTDNQNFILDCCFPDGIHDPAWVQAQLGNRPGLVGHGLFLDMATDVLAGRPSGVEWLTK